jgi:hypothetical protein
MNAADRPAVSQAFGVLVRLTIGGGETLDFFSKAAKALPALIEA